MKKFFLFLAAIALAMTANAKVTTISPDAENDALRLAVHYAEDGDIIEMTEGTYVQCNNGYVAFDGKSVTVKAAEGANVVLQLQVPITITNGGKANLQGIKIDASRLNDLADWYEHVIYANDATEGKELVMQGCELYGFNINKSAIYSSSSNTLALCDVKDCYFHDNMKSCFFFEGPSIAELSVNDTAVKGEFASGTALRRLARQGQFRQLMQLLPEATMSAIKNTTMYPDSKKQLPLMIWKLLSLAAEEIAAIYGVGEGMEYRLKEAASKPDCASSYSALIQELATRRYPATRIQRTLMHLLLGSTKDKIAEMTASGPLYIRVLAFDDMGRQLLKDIRQKTSLPIITKVTEYLNRRDMQHPDRLSPLQRMLYMDIAAANLRELCLSPLPSNPQGEQQIRLNADFTTSPVYMDRTSLSL